LTNTFAGVKKNEEEDTRSSPAKESYSSLRRGVCFFFLKKGRLTSRRNEQRRISVKRQFVAEGDSTFSPTNGLRKWLGAGQAGRFLQGSGGGTLWGRILDFLRGPVVTCLKLGFH